MKAVCLDFDHTLQDLDSAFDVAVETVWLPLASRYGRQTDALKLALQESWPSIWEEFMAGARTEPTLYPEWFHRAFRLLDLAMAGKEMDDVVHQYGIVFENSFGLYSDVCPALKRMPGWATPPALAILTNGPSERQRQRIRALGLEYVIPVWCISEEIGVGKPHSEFFYAALKTLDVRPEDAVMIGDSMEVDIVGAKAVGMKAIWLNRHGAEGPHQESSDGVAQNLVEAIRIIESWTATPS